MYKHFTKAQLEQAESNGLNYNNLISRLNSGWTIEKAITAPKISKNVRTSKHFTKEQVEIAKENGLSFPVINNRRIIGWSIQDCITRPISKNKGKGKKWTIEEEDELVDLYENKHINISGIAKRMDRTEGSIKNKVDFLGLIRM